MSKKQYTIKIDEDLFDKVTEKAKLENRSINNMFESLINRGLMFDEVDLSKVKRINEISRGRIVTHYEYVDDEIEKILEEGQQVYCKTMGRYYMLSFKGSKLEISVFDNKKLEEFLIKEYWTVPPGGLIKLTKDSHSWIMKIIYDSHVRVNIIDEITPSDESIEIIYLH